MSAELGEEGRRGEATCDNNFISQHRIRGGMARDIWREIKSAVSPIEFLASKQAIFTRALGSGTCVGHISC